MIFVGQVLHERQSLGGWRQPMGERAEESLLGRMPVPVEAVARRKNVVVKLHHRQDGCVQ